MSPASPLVGDSAAAAPVLASPLVEEPAAVPRIVHFSTECAVIPDVLERKRGPRLVTRTLSVPLWRRRVPSTDDAHEDDAVAVSLREEVVSVKVSIPSFRTRSSSRERTPTSPPLTPILRRSSTGGPPGSPVLARPARRPSLPTPRVTPAETVPLRPCCAACAPAVEEALREGAAWAEHFSRGARRRRSLSVDSAHAPHAHAPRAGAFAAIRVDEAGGLRPRAPSPPPPAGAVAALAALGPSLTRRTPSGASLGSSAASDAGVIDLGEPAPPKLAVPPPPPIREEEEDEEELFPLPSPRRSPSDSPLVPSPAGSTASLAGAPGPCLSPAAAAALYARAGGSTESVGKSAPARVQPPPLVRRSSPASSPGTVYRTPPSPAAKSSHHSWGAFFRAGADVLRGVNSIAG